MNVIERLFPRDDRGAAQPATAARPVTAGPPAGTAAPAPGGADAAANGTGRGPVDPKVRELELRRSRLAEQLAERQWDLGGVTYEMAIRDHFRMDVLVRLAAELQQVDAELAEVERLLRLEAGGAAGECPKCRSPHSRGAVYCWSCGTQLMPTATKQVPAA